MKIGGKAITSGAALVLVGAGVWLGVALRPSAHHSTPQSPPSSPLASALPGASQDPTDSTSSQPSVAPSADATASKLPKGLAVRAMSVLASTWTVLGDSSAAFSQDQGQHFSPLALPNDWSDQNSGATSAARGIQLFGSSRVVLWNGPKLWTGDLGGRWRSAIAAPSLGPVVGAAFNGETVYLLESGVCAESYPQRCRAGLVTILRDGSATSKDLALPPGDQVRSITANGTEVWILAVPGGGESGHILHSADLGAHFSPEPFGGGCLTGTLSAVSANVLWATCATGMHGYVARSTDGGKTFASSEADGGTTNAAQILGISPADALLSAPAVRYTGDGGMTWHAAKLPRGGISNNVLTFVDSGRGDRYFAIATVDDADGTQAQQVWQTVDLGRSWGRV